MRMPDWPRDFTRKQHPSLALPYQYGSGIPHILSSYRCNLCHTSCPPCPDLACQNLLSHGRLASMDQTAGGCVSMKQVLSPRTRAITQRVYKELDKRCRCTFPNRISIHLHTQPEIQPPLRQTCSSQPSCWPPRPPWPTPTVPPCPFRPATV